MYVLFRNRGSSERGRRSRWKRSLIGGCGGAWAMERLTLSDSRGEYWATCFSVLRQLASSSLYSLPIQYGNDVLVGDAVERAVVVEAKVAGVDDVVGAGVGGELVQRLQVSCSASVWNKLKPNEVAPTSYVCDAQHSYAALLDHAAAVGVQRDSARHGARGGAAIGEVVAGVGARLVGSLLEAVSMWGYGCEGLRSRARFRHTEAIE